MVTLNLPDALKFVGIKMLLNKDFESLLVEGMA